MDVSTAGLAPVGLVARIMDDVRETFPKDEALALALAKEGVVGDGGRPYSSKTVSAWATGKGMPPGHVVLIAARLAGLHLDRYLFPEETGSTNEQERETLKQHGEDIQEIRANQEVLLTTVADLVQALDELKAHLRAGQKP